jgi:hypothetical protein
MIGGGGGEDGGIIQRALGCVFEALYKQQVLQALHLAVFLHALPTLTERVSFGRRVRATPSSCPFSRQAAAAAHAMLRSE